MPFTYAYPRPSVACDVVAFTLRADDLAVLLIKRKDEPFKGAWALPGGFVNENESLERAAARELYEETGLSGMRLEQLAAFGDPGRDPRGHCVSIAWVSFRASAPSLSPGDDAIEAEWCSMRNLVLGAVSRSRSVPPPPPGSKKVARRAVPARAPKIELAFDHAKIITKAYRRLCKYLDDPVRDTAFDIVPPRFTLAELKRMYEIILGRSFTSRVIKQFFVDRGLVVQASTKPAKKAAAQLYRWNRR